MVATEAGEDLVVTCPATGYAANLEKAVSVPVPPQASDPEGELTPEEFHTPGRKTIAEIAEFTGLPETSQIKSLVMISDGQPILALLRGDHQLSDTKFAAVARGTEVRTAHPDEIRDVFGADAGSLGPVSVKNLRIIADLALKGRSNMICGANRNDYHLRNVTPAEDFQAEFHDIRQVAAGDTSIDGGHPLTIQKMVEIGHIFKLGYKYADAMGLRVLNESGEEVTLIMGSYGIGIERILSAAVELYADKDGMVLPSAIAPFEVVITPVNIADASLREAAERVLADCEAAGIDALLDDRDERPGVKFKDADLIGIPYRITIGKKLVNGMVEVVERRSKRITDIPVGQAAQHIRTLTRNPA
jgi:prolyl-tRNA synthetase